jgi:hypothetical protein
MKTVLAAGVAAAALVSAASADVTVTFTNQTCPPSSAASRAA